tara:strand:+ start:1148 stop:1855 length:708 start_codon:yes stop_codon:yes gene_type:complete
MIEKMEELKKLFTEERNSVHIYLPIVVNGELLREGNKRFASKQHKRLDHFDVEGKSVIDFGCNVGYITIECLRKGASYCVGVESYAKSQNLIKIANLVKELDKLENIDFIVNDIKAPKHTFNYGWEGEIPSFVKEKLPFDVGFLLSPFSVKPEHHSEGFQSYQDCIPQLRLIKDYAKVWYIEPTHAIPNRPKDREVTRDWGLENLKEFGNVEFLGYTDYQNRSLFRVTTGVVNEI